MAKPLADKVALVTGSSRGIGKQIALTLAARGANVVLTATNATLLDEVAHEITAASSPTPLTIPADLTDEKSIIDLVAAVDSTFGQLDILVNNAGITHAAQLQDTATADYDRLMAVNARAPFILCRQALPMLKKAPRGFIINIASIVGVKGYPNQSAYTASKHALRGMSTALAEELTETNITVHLLCPGATDTEMVSKVRPDIPKQKLINPKEIAEIVDYLTTHKGNAIIEEIHIRRKASNPWF
jgi:3-oxoacyl-[acyl-carrier protein] reductase